MMRRKLLLSLLALTLSSCGGPSDDAFEERMPDGEALGSALNAGAGEHPCDDHDGGTVDPGGEDGDGDDGDAVFGDEADGSACADGACSMDGGAIGDGAVGDGDVGDGDVGDGDVGDGDVGDGDGDVGDGDVGDGDVGDGDVGDGDEDSGDGTFAAPIVIDTFPATFSGDTTDAPSDAADSYSPCAPSTREWGGEFVFELRIPEGDEDHHLTITVDDVPGDGVDIDLHLLESPSADACFTRDNITVEAIVGAGETLYLAADTWTTSGGSELAGPFTLSFSLTDVDVTQCFVNPIPSCDDNTLPTPNGVPVEPVGLGGCPDGMARVDETCVDRWEAALVEVLAGGTLAPWSPYDNPGTTSVRAVSAPGLVPQAYINGNQAAAACANAGKRLCSDSEWLRACRGPSSRIYPYGNARQPGVCNDDRTCHPAVQYFETNANWVWSNLSHGCINQLPASVDATGANAGCVSEDGLHDMMGNLHEWTSNPAGTFRGGFYADTVINGDGCLYATTAHGRGYSDYSTGFRCCADPL